jgi:hypothetical protein
LDPDKPEYPTDEQMEAIFNGYLKSGKEGIAEALKRLYPDRDN